MCVRLQQTPERVGQSDAVYEVVSLQREAERGNEEKGRQASPTEEEEADEGINGSFLFLLYYLPCFDSILLPFINYAICYKLNIHR